MEYGKSIKYGMLTNHEKAHNGNGLNGTTKDGNRLNFPLQKYGLAFHFCPQSMFH